jgi:amyloid beta precursor protein binding protein 1
MAATDKYDRQLRLWGAKGQLALAETLVVLVGASAAGTETLKNLVLPGIGSFLVVDEGIVSRQDVASNFFLPSVGKARAEAASEYLRELNPDVKGSFLVVAKLSLVTDWKQIFYEKAGRKSVLVIASDLEPSVIEALSIVCEAETTALVVVQSYGLVGVVRVQLSGTVALLDPKPNNAHPDLRLTAPFPGLNSFLDSIDMETMEKHQHGHVPYPIILLDALREWRPSHNGRLPANFAEKQEFQLLVKGMRRDENEINFDEALQNAYLAYTEQNVEIPDDLDASSTLGKLYRGLQTFMSSNDGRPPLNGSIPDMTSSTDLYVRLQGIYKDQAGEDLKAMKRLCPDVSEDDVASFCANVFIVRQMETRSLVEEFQSPPPEEILDDLKASLVDPYEVPEHTPLLWYLGLRACQVFLQKYNRYPGTIDRWDADAVLLRAECWNSVVHHYQLDEEELVQEHCVDICRELTRYGNAEIHNIASVVGGVASQEAVKIITGQYLPLDNTYVFNGIAAVAGVYKL